MFSVSLACFFQTIHQSADLPIYFTSNMKHLDNSNKKTNTTKNALQHNRELSMISPTMPITFKGNSNCRSLEYTAQGTIPPHITIYTYMLRSQIKLRVREKAESHGKLGHLFFIVQHSLFWWMTWSEFAMYCEVGSNYSILQEMLLLENLDLLEKHVSNFSVRFSPFTSV